LGNCEYCGKPAGLLRRKHDECENEHIQREQVIQNGKGQILDEVLRAIKSADDFDDLEKAISAIQQSSFVPPTELRTLLINGWERSVERFLENGIVSSTEEERLVAFQRRFAFAQEDLNHKGAFTKLTKAAVLRDVFNGIVPQRLHMRGNPPVNLQKGEQIVWPFPRSQYLQEKVRREYVGGSQGLSVRVMKGVYYRAGAFRGRVVEHEERVHVDTGCVLVTNKNFYFAGSRKSMRLPYSKIVSFEPFSNGVGIMRDAATAKPEIFVTGDGWFTYNLVVNLARL
jgi:hypothetical protein